MVHAINVTQHTCLSFLISRYYVLKLNLDKQKHSFLLSEMSHAAILALNVMKVYVCYFIPYL